MAVRPVEFDYNGQHYKKEFDIPSDDPKAAAGFINDYINKHPDEFAKKGTTPKADTRSTFRKIVDYPGEGTNRAIKGAGEFIKQPSFKAANEVMEGGFQAMSPFAVPALVAAPEALALGVIGSGVGDVAGQGIAKGFNASPDAQEFSGNVGSVIGGMFGGSSPKVRMGSKGAVNAMIDVAKQPGITGGALKRSVPGILGSLGGALTGDYHNILKYGAAGELFGAALPYMGAAAKGAYEGGKGYPWLPRSIGPTGPKIGEDSVIYPSESTKNMLPSGDSPIIPPYNTGVSVDIPPELQSPPAFGPQQPQVSGQAQPQITAGKPPIVTPPPQAPPQITGPGEVARDRGAIPVGTGKPPQEGSNTVIPQNRVKGRFSVLRPRDSAREMMENATKGKKAAPKETEPKKATESKATESDKKVLEGNSGLRIAQNIADELKIDVQGVIDYLNKKGYNIGKPKAGKKTFGGAKPLKD